MSFRPAWRTVLDSMTTKLSDFILTKAEMPDAGGHPASNSSLLSFKKREPGGLVNIYDLVLLKYSYGSTQ